MFFSRGQAGRVFLSRQCDHDVPHNTPTLHPQVVSLITIEVHARDTIDKLAKANCSSVNDFEWVGQLRFYWDKDLNDCVVKQVLSVFVYGYEYQGNNGRLVITPLTDR